MTMCRDHADAREAFDSADEAIRSGYPCLMCGGLCDERFCSPGCQSAYEDEMAASFDEADTDHDMDYEGYQMTDVEADADTLASAGYGTDEDYGYYGDAYDGE
jgi:hypothetical protein